MKVIKQDENGATIELTEAELRTVYGILIELDDGPNSISDADWNMLISQPRHVANDLIDGLGGLLEHANRLDSDSLEL